MSKSGFLGRLISVVLPIVSLHVMGIELLIYFVMNPTLDEFKLMLLYPIPVAAGLVIIYCVIVYIYSRPILRFLETDGKGEKLAESQIHSVQDRCVSLPYFLAALSFPAYILGATLGVLIVASILEWPLDIWIYGLFAGIIAGLLTTPMAIYAGNWVMEPVLHRTIALFPHLEAAGTAGFRLSLRNKFIMIVIVLVAGITGYTMIVGYTQNDAVLKNMEKMEKGLLPQVAEGLLDEIEHATDPGIKSSRYFRSRVGSRKAFYITLMLVGSGLALILAIAVARETTRPIRILQTVAEQVRQGDYGKPVRLISNDELGELGETFNRMKETIIGQMKAMESMLETLRHGIMRMDETVNTVLSVSAEQSSGATEQASAVEETSTTVQEIAATARQIAERARKVDSVSSDTLNACHEGERKLDQAQADFQGIAKQVDAVMDAMAMLEDRFKEIYRIVELMEDIAEQTELLALNAALEAAGAGEVGRRFSVVADATRKLAARATESNKEIRVLVETIQEATMESTRIAEGGRDKVAAGASAIKGVVDALKTISSLAGSTSSAVHEITLSTEQQTLGSEQLATSVSDVSGVARRVAGGAKEIESAIAELREFAETLRTTVGESRKTRN
jgi:methyl-accepting chemotaxis protein